MSPNLIILNGGSDVAALGYRLELNHTRGRYVRCCVSPSPITYGDLAADQELSHAQA